MVSWISPSTDTPHLARDPIALRETKLIGASKLRRKEKNTKRTSNSRDGLFRQTIGVPTGTNCAPEIANIFLFYYELELFQQKLSAWNVLSKPIQCVLLSYMRYIDDIFSATSDASMIFEGSGGFMFGDSAQGTGIFPTAVKKADGSIIEKPLELEGEGGSSVNYELEFFQQKLSAWNVLSKPMFKSGGISTIFFSAMFGETAKWTGIFSTVVEKNEWLNHWKNTRTWRRGK